MDTRVLETIQVQEYISKLALNDFLLSERLRYQKPAEEEGEEERLL